ncbi:MAG: hypothetical protein LZF62_380171 [Nitrospira sp.]|nr:MAG: hypothetical protein LZF62_380171 [Nitrospira sp.]
MQLTSRDTSSPLTGLRRTLCLLTVMCLASACSLVSGGKVLYDQQDSQIGLQSDPTVHRGPAPADNNHPALLTAEDIRVLLGSLMVSGWSGTLVGILEQPRPVSVFTDRELNRIAAPIAQAFQQAGPTERVFFSLPKSQTTYSEERTTGALFLRGRYLHIVLTDHSAFTGADTAGGDLKDLRDTKGMRLWAAAPATAAAVPDAEEPRWAHFEKVHLSLNAKEVIALRNRPAVPSPGGVSSIPTSVTNSASAGTKREGGADNLTSESDELHLQVRELTSSNLELRDRLNEQHKQMQALQDQLIKLQQDLDSARSKSKTPRKSTTQ